MISPSLAEIRGMGQRLRTLPTPGLVEQILELTYAPDAKTARYAVLALGGAEGDATSEQRLIALWQDPDLKPEMRRAVLKSLGCVGRPETLSMLLQAKGMLNPQDTELMRIYKQALLILQRRHARSSVGPGRGMIRADVASERLRVRLLCRNGLERQVCLEAQGARILGPGRLELWHTGALSELWQSRSFEAFVIALPPEPILGGDLVSAAARILTGKVARHILTTLTEGPLRYRLAWQGEGRQSQLIWRTAELAQSLWPDLINDPRASTWEAQLYPRADKLYIDLVPKALLDPRFAYRVADVPAASHAPLAAALARIAGVRADDVVWDPFVGSGTELIERALLGPAQRIIGTDLDPQALQAASANTRAARLADRIVLEQANALDQTSLKPSLILTNPPLGRRVAHGESSGLLHRFLDSVGRQLKPGGRLVWVSPTPCEHAGQATRLGMRLTYEQRVDMGGFPSTIQRFERLI